MAIWVFSYPTGSPTFYIKDNHVFDGQGGHTVYSIQNEWWYEISSGKAAFYVQDKTVYTPNGKPTYYFSE